MAEIDDGWFDRAPKVELHLHLEGSIPLEALWALVEKYGGDPEVRTAEALAAKFVYTDFPHFIDTWVWKNRFLREAEDFTFIAEAVARDLARQDIVYAEAFFSPLDFRRTGLSPQRLAEAIRAGLDRVAGTRVQLVADLVRDFGPEAGAPVLEAVAEVQELGVVGIGIGGSEQSFPPEPYAALYERARALGFSTSAHAGEAAGAESVWGAIDALGVDRVGHGTRAVEDPALVEALAERGTPIECCPISNVRTGVIASVADHPIRALMDAGVHVTVSTDDPAMFNNSMAEEYRALHTHHGFGAEELQALTLAAVDAAFLPDEQQEALRRDLLAHPHWSP